MPDPPIKPPNKLAIDDLVTELTLSISEKYEDEKILIKRYPKMITHLIRDLAIALLKIKEYEKANG